MTTPSASSASYISRSEAARLFDGTTDHIYQGDLFQSLSLYVPRPGGRLDEAITHAIVISHDCEYTKIAHTIDKPLLVAPLREIGVFSQGDAIRQGQTHALWALPQEPPLDDLTYVVDFRLIQPIAVAELREATFWTCISAEMKTLLHARLARFLLRMDARP